MGCVSGARPKLPQRDSAVGMPASAGQHQALPVRAREKQCEAGIEGIGRPDREGVARMLDIRSEGLRRIACSIVKLTGPRLIAPFVEHLQTGARLVLSHLRRATRHGII